MRWFKDNIILVVLLIAIVITIAPIGVISLPCLKSVVIYFLKSKENAFQYLQFIGTFLGVIITIIITILLQNKNKKLQESKEIRYAKNYINTQLEESFNEYLKAKKENEKNKNFYYPKQIYIDPNWMTVVAKIQGHIDEDIYKNICFAFIEILNVDKKCEYIKDRINSIKDKEYNTNEQIMTEALNKIKDGDYSKTYVCNLKKDISEYVEEMCNLYDKKYKDIIELLKLQDKKCN